jgi:hypothetical protein
MLVYKLIDLLNVALVYSGETRLKAIKDFQNIVWDDTSIEDEVVNDILTDIAYILDFYEPNDEWRHEAPNYYGDDKLEEEIKYAMQKLEKYYHKQ